LCSARDGKTSAAISYGSNYVIHHFDAATVRELRRFWAEDESGTSARR
jgi:hypothetical protein